MLVATLVILATPSVDGNTSPRPPAARGWPPDRREHLLGAGAAGWNQTVLARRWARHDRLRAWLRAAAARRGSNGTWTWSHVAPQRPTKRAAARRLGNGTWTRNQAVPRLSGNVEDWLQFGVSKITSQDGQRGEGGQSVGSLAVEHGSDPPTSPTVAQRLRHLKREHAARRAGKREAAALRERGQREAELEALFEAEEERWSRKELSAGGVQQPSPAIALVLLAAALLLAYFVCFVRRDTPGA